jgi:hypothetical protein
LNSSAAAGGDGDIVVLALLLNILLGEFGFAAAAGEFRAVTLFFFFLELESQG